MKLSTAFVLSALALFVSAAPISSQHDALVRRVDPTGNMNGVVATTDNMTDTKPKTPDNSSTGKSDGKPAANSGTSDSGTTGTPELASNDMMHGITALSGGDSPDGKANDGTPPGAKDASSHNAGDYPRVVKKPTTAGSSTDSLGTPNPTTPNPTTTAGDGTPTLVPILGGSPVDLTTLGQPKQGTDSMTSDTQDTTLGKALADDKPIIVEITLTPTPEGTEKAPEPMDIPKDNVSMTPGFDGRPKDTDNSKLFVKSGVNAVPAVPAVPA